MLPRKATSILAALLLAASLCVAIPAAAWDVHYVSTTGNDNNIGLSWASPKLTVQAAINSASPGDFVWVKNGTYVLTSSINLQSGVEVHGGFAGNETSLAQRAAFPRANPTTDSTHNTILDAGDLVGVVTMPTNCAGRFDGFTVMNGSAVELGGGMCCNTGCSLTIVNNTFADNHATEGAGGALSTIDADSAMRIVNNTFADNTAATWGGGIYAEGFDGVIEGNTISSNDAGGAGGLYVGGNATVQSNKIAYNTAYADGGAYICGSSMAFLYNVVEYNEAVNYAGITVKGSDEGTGSPTVAGNLIRYNEAESAGGGIFCYYGTGGWAPRIVNNTVVLNTASANGHGGGILFNLSDAAMVYNNVIAYNSPEGAYCESGTSPTFRCNDTYNSTTPYVPGTPYTGVVDPLVGLGNGNISQEPQFLNLGGGKYNLRGASPCMGTGDNNAPGLPLLSMTEYSVASIQRILPPGIGTVDMGAYERDQTPPVIGIVSPSTTTLCKSQNSATFRIDVKAVWRAAWPQWVRVAIVQGTGTPSTWYDATEGSNYIWSYNWSVTQNGTYTIWAKTRDWHGNESEQISRTVTVTSASVNYVALGGTGDGSSWASPLGSVQTAINQSSSGGQVWVANGLYPVTSTITLSAGVAVYGGFAGTESFIEQRAAFPRVDSSGNRIPDDSSVNSILDGGGSYRVLRAPPYSGGGRLDGFTVRNGYASSAFRAGGMTCEASTAFAIANTTFKNNTVASSADAGALSLSGGPHTVSNCAILSNTGTGGNMKAGIAVWDGSPTIDNCLFASNVGTALWTQTTGSPTVTSNTFTQNGGASVMGGAISLNCTGGLVAYNLLQGNTALCGGGIYCLYGSAVIACNMIRANTSSDEGAGILCTIGGTGSACSHKIVNNTIVGNTAPATFAGGIGCYWSDSVELSNNIVASNSIGIKCVNSTPTLRNNDVWNSTGQNYVGIAPGVGDISVDPGFVNATSGKENYEIKSDSLCRDAGYNSATGIPAYDYWGNARIAGDTVDIGIHEYLTCVTIGEPSVSATTGGPVTYTVTYYPATTTIDLTGLVTLNTTGATGTISISGTGNTTRTITISSISGSGTLGISIAAGSATGVAAAGPSTTFQVFDTVPTVSVSEPSATVTGSGPVTYTLTFDGAASIPLDSDPDLITLNKTGTADGTVSISGTGLTTRTVTIYPTGDGTIGITVEPGAALDAYQNLSAKEESDVWARVGIDYAQLSWNDEFDGVLPDGTGLDTDHWTLGTYTDSGVWRDADVYVSGGLLHLRIPNDKVDTSPYWRRQSGIRTDNCGDTTCPQVPDPFSQQYGWFEIRARCAKGTTFHSGFWMMASDGIYEHMFDTRYPQYYDRMRSCVDEPYEIDMFEQLGKESDKNLFTAHYGGYYSQNHQSDSASRYFPFQFRDDYHIFALEWNDRELKYYVDGHVQLVSPHASKTPFNVILTLDHQTNPASWLAGPPEVPVTYPVEFVVDYVRVYQSQP